MLADVASEVQLPRSSRPVAPGPQTPTLLGSARPTASDSTPPRPIPLRPIAGADHRLAIS